MLILVINIIGNISFSGMLGLKDPFQWHI